MRVTHCVQVGPNRCGLYGTAKDLLKAEIAKGIDAGFMDVAPVNSGATINGVHEDYVPNLDKTLQVKSMDWAKKSDIIIRHSYIPVRLQASGIPLALALHGRPESSYRLETQMNNGIMTTIYKRARDDRYKGFLCFWKEFIVPWKLLVPEEKLFYVPAPVDLDFYNPKGTKFDISEHAGNPNILIADIWREDVVPMNLMYAATVFQQKYCPTAKLHILGLQGKNLKCMSGTLEGMKKLGVLGGVAPLNTKIVEFYRSMDMVITPHTIATRTVREPLACGVPVVAGVGNKYTPYTASHLDIDGFAKAMNDCWQDIRDDREGVKFMARKTAEIAFNLKLAGDAIKDAFERILR